MSEKLPFEDAFERQMDHLPLPDEDASWHKMKELLDKKEKRRYLAFFSMYQGCTVFIVLLLAGTWLVMHFVYKPEEKFSSKVVNNTNLHQKSFPHKSENLHTAPAASRYPVTDMKSTKKNTCDQPVRVSVITSAKPETNGHQKRESSWRKNYYHVQTKSVINSDQQKNLLHSKRKNTLKPDLFTSKQPLALPQYNAAGSIGNPSGRQKKSVPADTSLIAWKDGDDRKAVQLKDTIQTHADTSAKSKAAPGSPSLSHKKYSVSAGIGIQQQIPVFGQKSVDYGLNGNNSMLSDYIPSLYVRFENYKKWFLQAEFTYGAPQLVSNFSYDTFVYTDNFTGIITTISGHVKKTFYSQVPFEINYYIRPNWSVGAGGVYRWFHNAIIEKETRIRNQRTQSEIILKQIVPLAGNADSSMFTSHASMLVQTNYVWRRVSVGARFTKDIQPYIKYSLPNGTGTDRKNWSLGIMVQYALWKSKRL